MADFQRISLDAEHVLLRGALPASIVPDDDGMAALWDEHPPDYHVIKMHGRLVETPRWQQAYGADYHYTGRVNKALPLSPQMRPFLAWAREELDPRLNGILFNWYDPEHRHYIGKHRDSTKGMVEGAPIVTISLGGARILRMRPYGGSGFRDFAAGHGSVYVIPYATNLGWTHEVPHRAKDRGRRISVTLRAFSSERAEG